MVSILLRSFYVNDVVTGVMDENAALKLYEESQVFREGGFNLRKFTTNSPQLQKAIDRKESSSIDSVTVCSSYLDETYEKSTFGTVHAMSPTDQKVIGVKWDVSADRLIFSVKEIAALAGTPDHCNKEEGHKYCWQVL